MQETCSGSDGGIRPSVYGASPRLSPRAARTRRAMRHNRPAGAAARSAASFGLAKVEDQARGVEPAAAPLLHQPIELVDERRRRQGGAVAPALVEHDREILAHPADREAEV